MSTQQSEAAGTSGLEILGIGEAEERTYRWLVAHSGATALEVANALELTPARAQYLLNTIRTKGMTTYTPEKPRRYVPVAPDIALSSMALRRQEDLRHAQAVIQELQEQTAVNDSQGQEKQVVELITNHKAERQIIEQMARTAQREVLALVRPPMLVSRLDMPPEQDQQSQREAQDRGVHSRSIVDAEFLDLPGAVTRVRGDIEGGEEVKVLNRLPFKMVLTDRRLALIPLYLQQPESPVLLVRSSALLEALYALFEMLWERAAPISFTGAGKLKAAEPDLRLPEGTETLISLMAAGLNDKKIAYELGISASTLNRRLRELVQALDARTRFQAGWLAALRLFSSSPGSHR